MNPDKLEDRLALLQAGIENLESQLERVLELLESMHDLSVEANNDLG